MSIDRQKAPQLVSLLAASYGLFLTGCASASEYPSMPPVAVPTVQAVLSDICLIPSELLRPPSLSRESVITYPSGVVVNQAGSLIDLTVHIPHLERLDNEPALGLNFPGYIKIIYFFAGSLYRPDAIEQVDLFFQAQRPYFLARYCEEQGRLGGSAVVIALSVSDALAEVGRKDPAALERELTENYIQGGRIIIGRASGNIPDQLPSDALDRALANGLPFGIVRFNQVQGPF